MKPWICIRTALPLLSALIPLLFQPCKAAAAPNQDGNVSKAQVSQQPASRKNVRLAVPSTNRAFTQKNSIIESGRQNFLRYGCPVCHGSDLKGGLPNVNAQGGEVLSLVHLPDDYTKDEVIAIIRNGKKPPLQDPQKPAPPLYMPEWKRFITDEHIRSMVEYLWTKQQKSEEKW